MYSTETAAGYPDRDAQLPQVALEITRGRARHRRREVGGRAFLIGSAPDSDLVLGDARFDELYSYVYLTPQKVTIRRLGVGPDLCVGDVPASSASLDDGDRLRLGPYEFRVAIGWPEAAGQGTSTALAAKVQSPGTVDDDAALERLLRDVESYQSETTFRLYAG